MFSLPRRRTRVLWYRPSAAATRICRHAAVSCLLHLDRRRSAAHPFGLHGRPDWFGIHLNLCVVIPEWKLFTSTYSHSAKSAEAVFSQLRRSEWRESRSRSCQSLHESFGWTWSGLQIRQSVPSGSTTRQARPMRPASCSCVAGRSGASLATSECLTLPPTSGVCSAGIIRMRSLSGSTSIANATHARPSQPRSASTNYPGRRFGSSARSS